MRFLTCRTQPDSPPCLAVRLESGWFQLKGCRDFGDWLCLTPAERERVLADAQPISPMLYLPPVLHPPSVRDFYAFETHVRNAHRRRGQEIPPEWYQVPAFYFSNPASLIGHEQPVRKPPDTDQLDYELELAVIIGREGGDWSLAEAESAIAGFTIMNDWSARDIQRVEMRMGLGSAKAKDFATSLGPWVVTPDELEPWREGDPARGSRWRLTMRAWVNGLLLSEGNAAEMHWRFAELTAHAARNTRMRIGDVVGSGTVGTGCLLERPEGTHQWLQPGDIVELEIEGIGRLRNHII